jgi:hypothetical protein
VTAPWGKTTTSHFLCERVRAREEPRWAREGAIELGWKRDMSRPERGREAQRGGDGSLFFFLF